MVIHENGAFVLESRERKPELAELQQLVGGYIEAVDGCLEQPGVEAYGNEEGRLLGMQPNIAATVLLRWPYRIVGPVVILSGFEPEREEDAPE